MICQPISQITQPITNNGQLKRCELCEELIGSVRFIVVGRMGSFVVGHWSLAVGVGRRRLFVEEEEVCLLIIA